MFVQKESAPFVSNRVREVAQEICKEGARSIKIVLKFRLGYNEFRMPPSNQSSTRRRSTRFKAQLRARLLFAVVLSEESSASHSSSGKLHLVGHTKDISEVGLALVVPIAEIDERYLAGESNKMEIELYLPKGAIKITARPVHYRRLDESSNESIFSEGYLIGAEITKVSNRDLFVEYLSTLSE